MKKVLRMVTALSLACGAFAFTGCTDYEEDINSINNRLDALETGTIADVNAQVEKLSDALAEAEKTITELNGTVDGMEGTLTGLQSDVDALGTDVEGLSSSVSDLSSKVSALEALKGEVETLTATVNELKNGLANYATKEYVDATFATKEAVAELGTRLGAAEGKLEGFTNEMTSLKNGLSALQGKYDSELKISEVIAKIDAAQAAAVNAQTAAEKAQTDATSALGQIKALTDALGVYAEAGKLEASLEAINGTLDEKLDIEDFDSKFDAALEKALADDGKITEAIASAINEAVSKVTAQLDELLGQIPHRLTSLSLIPEFYLDGIETIPVWTLYYEMTALDPDYSGYVVPLVDRDSIILNYQGTEVRYHVSPSGVSNEDIEKPEFVLEKAIEVKSAVENSFISVADYNIENDELTVTLTKNYDAGSLIPEKPYIYTAALKVPISERNLIEGQETEAYVYSEYYKLAELYATVDIAELKDINNDGVRDYACTENDGHSHFSESFDAATVAPITVAARYDEKFDLLEIVTGCMNGQYASNKEVTKDELAELGLEFQFAIPTKKFEVGDNKTDQQAFAQIVDGHYLQSVVPGEYTDNKAAIGRTPVVVALLIDTKSGNLVDAAWFRIVWADQVIPATDLGLIKTFEYELNCLDFNGSLNWEEMNRLVFSQIGEDGISHEKFCRAYEQSTVVSATEDNRPANASEVSIDFEYNPQEDPTSSLLNWTLTVDQIGNVIDKLLAGEKVTYTVDVTVTPDGTDGTYYAGDIKFQLAVDVVLPALPEVEDYYPVNWDIEGELLRVWPLQIDDKYWDGQAAGSYTVAYNYPLEDQFIDVNKDGTFLTNILPLETTPAGAWDCRRWDLQFSASQVGTNNLYTPWFAGRTGNLYAEEGSSDGYHLAKGVGDAAHIWYTEVGETTAASDAFNWYTINVEKIELRLPDQNGVPTQATKDLLVDNMTKADAIKKAEAGELKTVTIDIWSRINACNVYKVKTFDVWYVNPLSIDAKVSGTFTDAQLNGSKVDVSKAFDNNVKDFVGNKVAVSGTGTDNPHKLMVYYGVKTPVWDETKALINIEKTTNDINTALDPNNPEDAAKMYLVSETPNDWSLEREGNNLVFYNRGGAAVTTSDVKIWVPVTVEHKWGTWTKYVSIALKPNSTVGGK